MLTICQKRLFVSLDELALSQRGEAKRAFATPGNWD